MNNKLIEIFKKILVFLKSNWIAVVIIVGLLSFCGVITKIANAKIDKKDAAIAISEKNIKDLMSKYNQLFKQFNEIESLNKEFLKEIKELNNQLKKVNEDALIIQEKYKDLKEKFEKMSMEEKDKALIKTLKEFNIDVQITNDTMIITFENRGRLLSVLIDLKMTKEKLDNQTKQITIYQAIIIQKDGLITNLNGQVNISKEQIGKLLNVINEKDKIIKNLKQKGFWQKVKSYGTKAVPALLIGILIGHLVSK